jgi:hypothetical protein
MVFVTPVYLLLIMHDLTFSESIGIFIISFTTAILFMSLYALPVSILAEYLSQKIRYRRLLSFFIHVAFSIAFFTYVKRAEGEIQLFNPGNLIAILFWGLDEWFRYLQEKKRIQ